MASGSTAQVRWHRFEALLKYRVQPLCQADAAALHQKIKDISGTALYKPGGVVLVKSSDEDNLRNRLGVAPLATAAEDIGEGGAHEFVELQVIKHTPQDAATYHVVAATSSANHDALVKVLVVFARDLWDTADPPQAPPPSGATTPSS